MRDIISEYKKDVAEETKRKRHKSLKWVKFKTWIRKNKWKIIITLGIITILLFPVATGTVIGNWINKFFGSIINAVTFY